MKTDSKYHRIALSRVATNLVLGMIPLMLLAHGISKMQLTQTTGLWLGMLAIFISSRILMFGQIGEVLDRRFGFVRIISCLLLASSLMAIFWKWQNLPLAFEIIILSFSMRWLLFIVETRNLSLADAQRQPLPSQATRTRRMITYVTGAVIPLLILMGLPPVPLLTLSFCLTAFAQWAITFEVILRSGGVTTP